jgi:hypothetical protein
MIDELHPDRIDLSPLDPRHDRERWEAMVARIVARAASPRSAWAVLAGWRRPALAAAALARVHGVPPDAVRRGLVAFVPDRHRNERVAEVRGVAYVDDSKATNPHAAAASLAAYRPVVWVAGGLLKGAPVDELVAAVATAPGRVVLVSAEVGLGVVPATRAGRLFRDELGAANSALAAACDEVLLLVAGLPLRLK